jgi:anti-sigma-K factor RskA
VLPGAALGTTLMWIASGGWRAIGAAVIVAAVLLVPLAKARNHDAIDVVVSALRDGRVDSPVLVRLKQETERIKDEAEAAAAPVDAADAIPAAETDHP